MPDSVPRRRAAAVLLFLGTWLALLLSALPGHLPGGLPPALARQMALESFAMTAELAPDGSVQVQETITARFEGSWKGLLRQIPLLGRRPLGLEPLGLTLESVSDGQGRPYRVENLPLGAGRELRIFIPNASDSTRTVVLRYRVRNGVRFYPHHDEFYWNVTGNGWTIPIGQVDARVRLPAGARGVHASVYTGPRGARGRDAELRIEPRQVTARSTRVLQPGEGLTLAVGFAKGLVPSRPWWQQALLWLQARLAPLLMAATALLLGALWWWRGRDPALGSVPVRYEPPQGLTPAVLAVQGHLRIHAVRGTWYRAPAFTFTLLTAEPQWCDLAIEERGLLASLFPGGRPGDCLGSGQLSSRYNQLFPAFQFLVREATLQQGFYLCWPADLRSAILLPLMVLGPFLLALVMLLLSRQRLPLPLVAHPLQTTLLLLTALVLVAVVGWQMPRRTPRGAAVLRESQGFLEFLRRVESPRYAQLPLTPALFERHLAYAMVAGLTKRWVAAFRGILPTAPDWYELAGNGEFDLDAFRNSLADCLRSPMPDLLALLESSGSGSSLGDSSSGSSGGGSSGGGDGGGGGGGF